MIEKIYIILVNSVPGIRDRYQRKRKDSKGIGRGWLWIYLLYLNFSYYVLRNKKLEYMEDYPYFEKKHLHEYEPESALAQHRTPEAFASELSGYDVVSFDVFDTLIFRPFSEPTDLFFVLGDKLKYLDFKRCAGFHAESGKKCWNLRLLPQWVM